MLAEMLRSLPLPGTSLQVAWKTGTSNGSRDAWCGNKDGSRAAALVGAGIAAPAVGEIFEMLYARRAPPVWPFPPDFSEEAPLCVRTGLRASTSCAGAFTGRVLKEIPLALCEDCGRPAPTTRIVSPAPGQYRLADGASALELPLSAGGAEVTWFIDGAMLPPGASAFPFAPGPHTVAAVPADPAAPPAQVSLSVR